MRLSRSLKLPLLLASPFWLVACSQADAPAAPAEAAPAPMSAAAGPTETRDDLIVAPSPNASSAPFVPADADQAPPAESGPNAPADTAAAGDGDARGRIERVLGDADQYETVFKALQQGIAGDDRAAVAALMRYPLRVDTGGSKREVPDAATFQRDYERIVTAPVARAISAQSFDTVFANQQGVMIGNGQAWLNGTCLDKACSRTEVKVVALQE
ncbi:hypothetical protein [Stenotrophomonas sp. CFBP8980]|uniref:hypothetical protein n=1 Tax=Stenotrophomonas sp. CFBP8980 TaxID=3096523 RepID=UPI0005AF37BB|nr:hypothetical protein [Stenotrophomonas sp. CFBP8980]MDY1033582.1 hypothetical protein [Stenotrophomonas sp. CFBP8980]